MSRRTGDAADPMTQTTGGAALVAGAFGASAETGRARVAAAQSETPDRLESAHRAYVAESDARMHPFLRAAHRAGLVAFDGGGRNDASDRLAVGVYVATAVASLAAEGELDEAGALAA